jgi:N-methylhydantoinase B/oxoprolinase/acetone carboxylase alpha subunit
MPYIDQNGKTWTRSDDGLSITCEDGRKVLGNAEMSDEYLVSVAYQAEVPVKSDAERIADLEAQLAALLSRL